MVGDFQRDDSVQLCDANGVEIARGLSNYSAEDLRKIVNGKLWKQGNLAEMLGYGTPDEAIHRWVLRSGVLREVGYGTPDKAIQRWVRECGGA